MIKKVDIAIVGGGLIGASLALLLAQRTNLSIAVVERGKQLPCDKALNQRVFALGKSAVSVLSEVGVFDQLDNQSAYPYKRMQVWDHNTDAVLAFESEEYQEPVLGHMVDGIYCTQLLQSRLSSEAGIETYFQCEIQRLEQTEKLVSIVTQEQEIQTSLLIAADGAQSWVRQQAKIFCARQSYDQLGIVATIHTELSHQDTAWQRFLATGPIALLPLANNQCSIVWSAQADYAEQLLQLSPEQFEQLLSDAIDIKLGEVELRSERQAFPLHSQRAEQYFKKRIVLVGDAAHSIHPLAGQGANLGFKDMLCLVEQLQELPAHALADSKALQRYQRTRKADNEQTDWLMTALHNAYQAENPWWLLARARGVGWLANSTSARAILVRQALGS